MSTIPSIYGLPDFQSSAFIQGFLPIAWTNTTVTYGPGSARAINSDLVIEYPGNVPNIPGNIVVNTAIIGANGVYPVAIASQTPSTGVQMLPVFLVFNSSGTSGGSLNGSNTPAIVISTAGTSTTTQLPNIGFVPNGYDSYRHIGFVLVDTSGNLVPYTMSGNYQYREVMFHDAISVLSAGALIGPTKVDLAIGTLTSPSTTYYLPWSIVKDVTLRATFTNNTNDDTGYLVPHGLTVSSVPPILLQGPVNAVAAVYSGIKMPVGNDNGIASIDYSVSATDCTLSVWLSGFTFNLPFDGNLG